MQRLPVPAARFGGARPALRLSSCRSLSGLTGLLLASAVLFALPVSAHEFKAGSLTIEHPWSRATPPGASVGAGYLVITNAGSEPDRLVAATAEAAGHVEIHKMEVKDGVMTMAPVAGGLEIPAGGSVELKPGSFHLMLMDLKSPLEKGEDVDGSLTFEKAGTVKIHFDVQGIDSAAPEESGDGD